MHTYEPSLRRGISNPQHLQSQRRKMHFSYRYTSVLLVLLAPSLSIGQSLPQQIDVASEIVKRAHEGGFKTSGGPIGGGNPNGNIFPFTWVKCGSSTQACPINPSGKQLNPLELNFFDAVATSGSISFGEPKRGLFPDSVKSESTSYTNCSTTPQNFSDGVTIAVDVGLVTKTSKTLKLSQSFSIKVSGKYPAFLKTADIGADVSQGFTTDISVTDEASNSKTEKVSRTITFNRVVQPNSKYTVRVSRITRTDSIPFEGKVVVDGGLNFRAPHQNHHPPRVNQFLERPLSEVFPDQVKRTIPVSGDLLIISADELVVKDDVEINPSQCKKNHEI